MAVESGGRAAVEPTAFGVLLRRLRVAAGMTQEELAERAQLSERAIRRLEHDNERTPRLQTVRLLAEALELGREGRARLLAAAGAASSSSTASTRSSLHRVLGPLIGREEDLAIVQMLLEDRRLVTVTGAGGVGKTRLALAMAEQVSPHVTCVTIVELASLRDPGDVLSTIAACLAIRDDWAGSLFDHLSTRLSSGSHLLVLDNMEHLLESRTLVLDLLDACEHLTILTTSREPLRVRGERVYTLGPLLLPESAGEAERSPAVRLFRERAEEAGATLAEDEVTKIAVAEICRRLDGLPLAIELAAAWAPGLPPPALLDRLGERLANLGRGPADLPARQRTMRDAIGWSHDLLDLPQRALFRRLSVFAGGCTLDAVEAVCESEDVLRGLVALVDKSLVWVEEIPTDPARPRFRMLETVREFARDQLGASKEADSVTRAHARHYVDLAETARPQLDGPDQVLWLERLEREHDNFRMALRMAQQDEDVDLGLRLAATLWPFWHARGHWHEAQKWLGTFLTSSTGEYGDPSARVDALLAVASLAGELQSIEAAEALLSQVIVLAEQSGNDRCHGLALYALSGGALSRGEYAEAERMMEESLRLLSRAGDRSGAALVLRQRAGVYRYQGDFEQALRRYQDSLALCREVGDTRGVADTQVRIGQLLADRGRAAEALGLYAGALAHLRQLADTKGIADVLYRTGSAASDIEEYGNAVACFQESLVLYRSLDNNYGAAYALMNHAEAAVRMGDAAEAKVLATESLRLFEAIGDRRCIVLTLVVLADVAREERNYEEAHRLYQESFEASVELNLRPGIVVCLEKMARLACTEGKGEAAACLHGAASSLREEMDAIMPPADRKPYDLEMVSMRRLMGAAAFEQEETRGRNLSSAEVAALVREQRP